MNRNSAHSSPPDDFFTYRKSARWQARKRRYFERNARTCSICRQQPYSSFDPMKRSGPDHKPHLIHLFFDRLHGEELDSDLAVLCQRCYEQHLALSRESGEQLSLIVLRHIESHARTRDRRQTHVAKAKAERASLRAEAKLSES